MNTVEKIFTAFSQIKQKDPRQMGALTLAYVGDTVYDLYVRTYLAEKSGASVHTLHLTAAEYVCAAGQAAAYRVIEAILTEEESTVFHRGRNAHSGTVPKNASVSDYRIATGMEALFGFLYLEGRDERLSYLMERILSHRENTEETDR